MKRAMRAETKKAPAEPFASAGKRYAKLVRGVRELAAGGVKTLESEAAALERSARKAAVGYLRLAVKELRRLEAELGRMEKRVAPAAKKSRRPRARKARAPYAAAAAA